MPQLKPPIHYFGYREDLLTPLFELFSDKQYARCIDVFAGSGSFSLHAMSREVPFAMSYHLSDRFKPCMAFLAALTTSSEALSRQYTTLVKATKESQDPAQHYASHVNAYNRGNDETKMQLIAYLTNLTFQGELRFDEDQRLISQYSDKPIAVTPLNFTAQCQALERTFKQSKLTFSEDDFIHLLEELSPGFDDFVILDAPYPDAYVDGIYEKYESKVAFHQKLQYCVDKLVNAKIDFVLCYGALIFPEAFLIQTANHFVHVSGAPEDVMGEYLEHFYFPPHLVGTIDFQVQGFYPYEEIKSLEYEQALSHLQEKQIAKLSMCAE